MACTVLSGIRAFPVKDCGAFDQSAFDQTAGLGRILRSAVFRCNQTCHGGSYLAISVQIQPVCIVLVVILFVDVPAVDSNSKVDHNSPSAGLHMDAANSANKVNIHHNSSPFFRSALYQPVQTTLICTVLVWKNKIANKKKREKYSLFL